jgi:hypothetical protein
MQKSVTSKDALDRVKELWARQLVIGPRVLVREALQIVSAAVREKISDSHGKDR